MAFRSEVRASWLPSSNTAGRSDRRAASPAPRAATRRRRELRLVQPRMTSRVGPVSKWCPSRTKVAAAAPRLEVLLDHLDAHPAPGESAAVVMPPIPAPMTIAEGRNAAGFPEVDVIVAGVMRRLRFFRPACRSAAGSGRFQAVQYALELLAIAVACQAAAAIPHLRQVAPARRETRASKPHPALDPVRGRRRRAHRPPDALRRQELVRHVEIAAASPRRVVAQHMGDVRAGHGQIARLDRRRGVVVPDEVVQRSVTPIARWSVYSSSSRRRSSGPGARRRRP